MTSYITDLAASCLPNRGEKGILIMLECYLDDSGTHDKSKVLVWGGVAAEKEFFDQFDKDWKDLLENPCDGKPPVKQFHSYDLARSEGEFFGYNQAERDLTRANFRKVIAQHSLTWISYGISVEDWKNVFPAKFNFPAEELVFGYIVKDICESAVKARQPISFHFDKGRQSQGLMEMIDHAIRHADIDPDNVSYVFAPVAPHSALQAADLVAHETYIHFCNFLQDRSTMPDAHLSRLCEDAFAFRSGFFGENEIRAAYGQWAAKYPQHTS